MFKRVPTTYVLAENKKIIFLITHYYMHDKLFIYFISENNFGEKGGKHCAGLIEVTSHSFWRFWKTTTYWLILHLLFIPNVLAQSLRIKGRFLWTKLYWWIKRLFFVSWYFTLRYLSIRLYAIFPFDNFGIFSQNFFKHCIQIVIWD